MNGTFLSNLHLMRPEWLWALLPAAVFALLLWRQRSSSGSWRSVIAPELLPHLIVDDGRGRARNLLPWLIIAWITACVAAAGPSWRQLPQPVHQKQDALVMVMDLSLSMKSGDLAPSRVDRARQKLIDLLARRTEGQTALVAYAGDAHTVTPLTDDNPTITNLLPALNPDMMPLPGSDPLAAIEQALNLLESAGIRRGHILLLTDGIGPDEVDALATLVTNGRARLSILGVGTETGAPIPLPRGGFLKDDGGAIVMPALDESPLRLLAQRVGGIYLPIQIDGGDLDVVLDQPAMPDGESTRQLERTADAWEDQGYWLVLALLPLALLSFRRGWLICIAPLILLPLPREVSAEGWADLWLTPDQQGKRALDAGDAATAAELFQNPDWAGTAAYANDDFERAIENFPGNDEATADQWYNRGNALARAGQLEAALEAYSESLARAPGRQDASDNFDLVKQLLEQQQQQQQQEQEQEQDGEQQQEQNDAQDQQQSESDSNESPSPGGQDQNQDGESEQPPPPEESEGDRAQDTPDESEPREESEQENAEPDGEPEPDTPAEDQPDTPAAGPDPQTQERDQAMEQWLRRIPDDPSGLLREKFRYESRQRQQQQRGRRENEKPW